MCTELTRAVKKYQKNEIEIKTVEDMVAVEIYNYPPMRRRWNEDECGDFLCHFYSRIRPMINRFKDQGAPFEALLKVAVRFQMKSFGLRLKEKRVKERVLTNGDFLEKSLLTETSRPAAQGESGGTELEEIPIQAEMVRKNEGIRRRLLFLIMREHERISDSFLTHFIFITGYNRGWVEDKLEKIKEMTRQALERKELCRRRKNTALFNIYYLHEQLREYQPQTEKERLCAKIEKEIETIRRTEKAMARICSRPTHRQLSELLQVPKGTIDSGLYYLVRKYMP